MSLQSWDFSTQGDSRPAQWAQGWKCRPLFFSFSPLFSCPLLFSLPLLCLLFSFFSPSFPPFLFSLLTVFPSFFFFFYLHPVLVQVFQEADVQMGLKGHQFYWERYLWERTWGGIWKKGWKKQCKSDLECRKEGWAEASSTALSPREGSARLLGHPRVWVGHWRSLMSLEEACHGIRAVVCHGLGAAVESRVLLWTGQWVSEPNPGRLGQSCLCS